MENEIIPGERIQQAIHVIRGKKVMLDRDLALLYAIPTKALKQAVRRNPGEISGGLHVCPRSRGAQPLEVTIRDLR
jgi:hypothetical protein